MDNKPCPLSEEQIISVAENDLGWCLDSNEKNDMVKFGRRLLSLAVPGASAHSQAEPVRRQYYFQVTGCRAKSAHDPTCICWHDEGTGPMQPLLDGTYLVDMTWRTVVAPPAPSSEAVPMTPEEVESCFMAWGHPVQDFYVAFLKDDIQGVARLLFRKAAGKSAASNSEAVKELVEALLEAREALQFANDSPGGGISDTIWMMHRPETLFDFLDAALAKHGTKTATPSDPMDLQPEPHPPHRCCDCAGCKAYWAELPGCDAATPSPSDLTAYGEKVREAAAMISARYGDFIAREITALIRSMPLPAQSEGEEK